MNTEDAPRDNAPSGEARIAALNQELAGRAIADRRRHGLVLALLAVVALIVSYGFAQISALARNLDSDTLAYMGRSKAAEHLPLGRAALQDALRTQAPEIVDQALTAALDSVPSARGVMVDQVNANLSLVNTEFESTTLEAIGLVIDSSRASVDKAYPPDAFVDREMLMAHAAATQVRTVFDEALDELYPLYSARMSELSAQVTYLATTPDAQLTSLERKHRDIIQTVLQLVSRAEDSPR